MPPICLICGSTKKLLFQLEFYCPKDCDRKDKAISSWKQWKDSDWFYQELKADDIIPADATHGWWLTSIPELDITIEIKLAIKNLPWLLTSKYITSVIATHRSLAVFRKVF